MIPTIGRIVHYTLNSADAEAINKRRADAISHLDEHREQAAGVQIHVGNTVREGETYPMVITRAWGHTEGSAVNGQVMLDGNDLYWATSRCAGEGPGFFSWPVKV